MQELILVISRCVSRRINRNNEKTYYRFHFLGFYCGHKIRSIHLFADPKQLNLGPIAKGEDYLLWVKKKRINQEILEVELIKYKKII